MTMHSATQFGGEVSSVTLPPASLTVFVVEVASPSFEIGGLVRDTAGRPLAGVTVEATNGTAFTAVTDDYGIYRLSDLPEDAYTVSVTGVGDHVGSSQQVDLQQEPFPIANFTLTPRLSGAVKRWNTQHTELLAVPGAVVWVEPSGGGDVVASTTTDCEGNFTLPVAAGSYVAKAEHPGYAGRPGREVDVSSSAGCIAFTVGAGGGAVPCSQ